MSDWIEEFMQLTDTIRSPPSFRLWAAIATIAATLERRVWTHTDVKPLYPNLYTVLAGDPASGKTLMVEECRNMLAALSGPDGIHLGPDDPTRESFLDALEKSLKISLNGSGEPFYSAMTATVLELGIFIAKYDVSFLATLSHMYDNPPIYTAPRRTSHSITIDAPTVNLLIAAVPDAIGEVVPEIAWNQGFTSRVIFVYGAIPNLRREIFKRRKETDREKLAKRLKTFFKELHGEFVWEPDAQDAILYWYNDLKMAPVPTYGRLLHYNSRRNEHLMKLSMISAVAANNGTTVTLADFTRAQKWLFEAEEAMPNVFRAMGAKSDAQLLADAHQEFYIRYSTVARDRRQPIPEKDIALWFESRTTHDKIEGMIKALEKTGRMRRQAGGLVPSPYDSRIASGLGE